MKHSRGEYRVPRWGWVALVTWYAIWAGIHLGRMPYSWHYFVQGVRILSAGSRALHLYHDHPELQIGPVAFVVAAPFVALPAGVGALAAALCMSAAGIGVAVCVASLMPTRRRWVVCLPAVLAAPAWAQLSAGAGHLDDVLAILFAASALLAVRRRNPVLAGVLLALAADSKPWAIAFVVVLVSLPSGMRWRAGLAWAAVVAVVWAPFVLADGQTIGAVRFRLHNAPGSALRALGVTDSFTPAWCRPAQLAAGVVLGLLLWRLRRPAAGLFGVVASRLLLDPGAWSYYAGGLLATSLIVDVAVRQRRGPRLPWFTAGAFAMVFLPSVLRAGVLGSAALHGYLRAVYLAGALVAVLCVPMRDLLADASHRPHTGRRAP